MEKEGSWRYESSRRHLLARSTGPDRKKANYFSTAASRATRKLEARIKKKGRVLSAGNREHYGCESIVVLVVLNEEFEECLLVLAHWTLLWGVFSLIDVAAVAALPLDDSGPLEYLACF